MELSIISRVAEFLNGTKQTTTYDSKKGANSVAKSDSVVISDLGSEIKNLTEQVKNLPESNSKRDEKLEMLKQKIEEGKYSLNESAVDSIAEKIANSLL